MIIDGFWEGKVQKMNYAIGISKGLQAVFQKRGIDTSHMNGDQMRKVLGSYSDFKNKKCRIEHLLVGEHQHVAYFLPKYHCELNPIQRVWVLKKWYTKAYCYYSIVSLIRMLSKL